MGTEAPLLPAPSPCRRSTSPKTKNSSFRPPSATPTPNKSVPTPRNPTARSSSPTSFWRPLVYTVSSLPCSWSSRRTCEKAHKLLSSSILHPFCLYLACPHHNERYLNRLDPCVKVCRTD